MTELRDTPTNYRQRQIDAAKRSVAEIKIAPCPFCGNPLTMRGGVNPYGRCTTDGCFGERLPVVNVPYDVEAWNKRGNAHADLVQALENLANSVFESGLTAHNTEPWMAARAALAKVQP
jgi:hypothetical protein